MRDCSSIGRSFEKLIDVPLVEGAPRYTDADIAEPDENLLIDRDKQEAAE